MPNTYVWRIPTQVDLNEEDTYFTFSASDIPNIEEDIMEDQEEGHEEAAETAVVNLGAPDWAELLGKVSEANRQINLGQHASAIASDIYVKLDSSPRHRRVGGHGGISQFAELGWCYKTSKAGSLYLKNTEIY